MYKCTRCESPYGYEMNDNIVCPECNFEWKAEEAISQHTDTFIVKDVNGNILQDGDNIVVIRDLPVRGAPKPVKAGTLVKKIRLVDGDHNIDCKIDGFGKMGLKSKFVKKA